MPACSKAPSSLRFTFRSFRISLIEGVPCRFSCCHASRSASARFTSDQESSGSSGLSPTFHRPRSTPYRLHQKDIVSDVNPARWSWTRAAPEATKSKSAALEMIRRWQLGSSIPVELSAKAIGVLSLIHISPVPKRGAAAPPTENNRQKNQKHEP